MKRDLKLLMLLSFLLAWNVAAQAASNEDMFAAVKSGNAPEVKRLLAAGGDANGRDDRGATPLIWAAVFGYKEIAEQLVASDSDINARDKEGFAALHAAAHQHRKEIVELLLRKGAEVNASSTGGWTALHKAMERLANPETSHFASASLAEIVGIVEALLFNGADVNARTLSGGTPLHLAANSGQKVLVELLISKGANINSKSDEGVAPLYAAVKLDRAEIAELLIARGAEVNAATKSGYTPLLWAAHTGNKDIVELLSRNGADLNAKDINGRTPLVWTLSTAMMASRAGQAIMSRDPVLSSAPKQEELQKEIKRMKGEWRAVAKLLIARGAEINVASKDSPLLYLAANAGYKDVVEVLIDRSADLDDASAGETALHAAIAEKHRDVAELLIRKGANVNAHNRSARTPLHFLARDIDDRKLAELMIERGADINARDKNGETPLIFATRARNHQVAAAFGSSALPYAQSPAVSGQRPEFSPPPDESLSLDSYAELGLPSHERTWGPDDWETAAKVLGTLANRNPRNLPRLGSVRSSAVFARLTSSKNFSEQSTGFGDAGTRLLLNSISFRALKPFAEVFAIYVKAAVAGDVGLDEIVEFLRVYLRVVPRVMRLRKDLVEWSRQMIATAGKDHPNYSKAQSAIEYAQRATPMLWGMISDLVNMITQEDPLVRPRHREQLAGDLEEMLSEMSSEIPQSVRSELIARLERSGSSAPAGIQTQISRIVARLAQPSERALQTPSVAITAAPASPLGAPVAVPDESLEADEYVQAGLPHHERRWLLAEWDVVAKVLRVIAQKNPRQLPRKHSARSGPVFAALISPENLPSASDTNFDNEEQVREFNLLGRVVMPAALQIMFLYAQAADKGDIGFEEAVDVTGWFLRLVATGADARRSVRVPLQSMLDHLPISDPQFARVKTALDELQKPPNDFVNLLTGVLVMLRVTNVQFRTQQKVQLTAHLQAVYPQILRDVSPGVRAEFFLRVQNVADEAEPELQAVLRKIREMPSSAQK